MGKNGKHGGGGRGHGGKKPPTPSALQRKHGSNQPETIRQRAGGGGAAASAQNQIAGNQAAALRAQHLLRVATWASATVPPLGALLGARLGCLCEAAGTPAPATPHSICERCESILQVGVNCSVRVTKEKRKQKSRKTEMANSVTYFCHFCKHGNVKSGTPKKYVKTKISQAAARSNLATLGNSPAIETTPENSKASSLDPTKNECGDTEKEVSRPLGLSSAKGVPTETGSSAKKRKRKGWATLKELASSPSNQACISRPSGQLTSFLSPLKESAALPGNKTGPSVLSKCESIRTISEKMSLGPGPRQHIFPSSSTPEN